MEDSTQHFDELLIAVGMLLQLRAHLRQGGRETLIWHSTSSAGGTLASFAQSLNGAPLRKAPRLACQHRQIMPGIVDNQVAPELSEMVGHHLVVEQDHDTFSMRPHQHHPTGRPRIDAVAVVIGHDQARGGGPHRLLDEAVKRPALRANDDETSTPRKFTLEGVR